MPNILDGNLIQEKIVAAENGATIVLENAGEYEGPILIDRPVHLSGRGRLTTLWRRRGPVVVITSPQVTLSDLHIEVTEQDAPAVLYQDGCEPLLTNVSPQGIASQAMSERNTIHLGTFARGKGIRLPFELEDDFPHNQLEELPDYLEYDPESKHNRHARRVFWLRVKPPQDDAYIIDSLKFTGGTTDPLDFHVSGVVEANPPGMKLQDTKIKATIRHQQTKNVYFPSGILEITNKQLSVIAGEPIPEARYCNVFYDDSDRLCLWIPFQKGHRVRYADQTIHPWTRHDVVPGKVLQFSGANQVELVFEERGKQSLSISQPGLAFREVSKLDTRIDIELKKEGGFLARGKREFTVTPLVDWIEAPKTITVDRQGTVLTVGLSREALNLKHDTAYLEPAALAIHDENDVFFLAASISLKLPEYAFDIRDPNLVFALPNGDPIYAAEIPEMVTSFTVRNLGQNPINVKAKHKPEWLDLSQELEAEIAPGKYVEVGVRLNQSSNTHLRPGKHDIRDCVVLEDGHGNEVSLHVQIEIEQERLPTMRIVNSTIKKREFNIDHFNRPTMSRKGRIVRLQNMGSLDGTYRVKTSEPAYIYLDKDNPIREDRTSFVSELGAGKETEVFVQFSLEPFRRSQVGDTVKLNIEIESSKDGVTFQKTDQYSLVYQIVKKAPKLKVAPAEIDLGELIEYEPFNLTETITVTNEGTDAFDGRWEIRPDCQEWVRVSNGPKNLQLGVGESAKLKVEVSDGLTRHLPNPYDLGVVRFIRNDTEQEIAAFHLKFTIRPSVPEPHIHTRAFWFGKVEVAPRTYGGTDYEVINQIPPAELVIGNYGTQAWNARVTFVAPWLDVPFKMGDVIAVPADKVVRIPVKVIPERLDLTTGPLRTYPLELESDNLTQEVPRIPAYLLVEEAKPEIVATPNPVYLGRITSGQVEPLRKTVRLENVGKVEWHPSAYHAHEDNVVFETLPAPLEPKQQSRDYEIRWNERYPARVVNEITHQEDLIYITDDQEQGVIIVVEFDIHPPSLKMLPDEPIHLRASTPRGGSPSASMGSAFQHLYDSPGSPSADAEKRLTIVNQGDAPFTLVLQSNTAPHGQGNFTIPDWLELDPYPADPIRILPDESQTFNLRIHPDYTHIYDSGYIELVLPGGMTLRKEVSCG